MLNNRVEEFLSDLKRDKIVQKNLYQYNWLSGSSTDVTPIIISCDEICLQWKSNRNCYEKFINRYVYKYSDIVKYGYFRKSDGSCLSAIVFKLKERQYGTK